MPIPDRKTKTITRAPHETVNLGKGLAKILKPGDIIYLYGDLGSGKTVLTKGICKGLGVKDEVTSSSFVIVTEYEGRLPVSHIDLYRLQNKEPDDLPLEEYSPVQGITIIEWADRTEPRAGVIIRLKIIDKNSREITIEDLRN